uniref:Uncharacterized protein n=1 Tax=Candidatus Kentrum sp. FM TaxID=2126340 RepID=A0A450TW39_9GAMM|nr:MAG: hypothetical protein BECKFM1743C_GA0114222_107121 [Candidatus Kentron sp. FM]VFK20344.1 MAG: hypothetical protein BECKFM1743B_GA0114221_106881 [Candidatus Kentron sp. FM]
MFFHDLAGNIKTRAEMFPQTGGEVLEGKAPPNAGQRRN